MVSLLGSADENLRFIERSVKADVHVRGDTITLTGAPKDITEGERLFYELIALINRGDEITVDVVRRTVGMLATGEDSRTADLTQNIISRRGRGIRPKTVGQKRYVDAIDSHTVVFGIGPAGTGKTYLAMAKAVQALQAKQINRIILTRPAVEAGERLGYLPGTLFEKIDPYLRPLYDALHDMIDPDSIPRLIESGTIEVAPLAYMRGRAHPVDTKVLTPDGWRPIGDLAVGDLVVGSDGTPTPVIGVYPQGVKDIYRFTTDDGASVLCSDEHLWSVFTDVDASPQVLETTQIADGLLSGRRYELPLVSRPVEFPERDLRVDPYAFGRLLGAGGSADAPSVAAQSEAAVMPPSREASTGGAALDRMALAVTVAAPMAEAMRWLDETAEHARFIPDDYRYNTAEHRRALLRGLLDSAGVPVERPDGTCPVRFTTASTRLRDDVIELVQSLGGVVDTLHRSARDGDAGPQAVYSVDLRIPDGIEPFGLPMKCDAYRRACGGGNPRRFVDSVEYTGEAEAVCIQVAAEDSLYVTENYLVTHNTLNDAFIILDEAQNTTPEQMKMFLTRLGFGSKVVVTGDVTQVDLPGGAVSGLRIVREILEGVDDLHFAQLSSGDVVRHQLVADIVDAYAKWDAGTRGADAPADTARGGRKPPRRR